MHCMLCVNLPSLFKRVLNIIFARLYHETILSLIWSGWLSIYLLIFSSPLPQPNGLVSEKGRQVTSDPQAVSRNRGSWLWRLQGSRITDPSQTRWSHLQGTELSNIFTAFPQKLWSSNIFYCLSSSDIVFWSLSWSCGRGLVTEDKPTNKCGRQRRWDGDLGDLAIFTFSRDQPTKQWWRHLLTVITISCEKRRKL